MDAQIKAFAASADKDLALCHAEGVAYQRDMSVGRVSYDGAYLAKVDGYDEAVSYSVNNGRCALLKRYLSPGDYVLDVGAGSGAFIFAARVSGFEAYGYDVMPEAVERLTFAGRYAEDPRHFDAITCWDSLEHMEDPSEWLRRMPAGAMLFASVPTFDNLSAIRASKHYRPGEHLYYWTRAGFISWAQRYSLTFLEVSDHEVRAGREGVDAFVFRRTSS